MSSKSNPAGGKFNPKYLPKIQKFFSKNECPKWNDLETFEREKKSLLRTNNFSNIAKYFEINDNGDRFEFLMESWEWGSLRDVYSSPKYIYTMNLVLDWSKQLFSALGYLNCRNILQQDICPENVIMTGDFSLKLAYFPTIPNLIGGQRYEGVEKYGRAEWDESFKNQVYSIGLIIWEIIERRRVFEEYDRDGKFQVDQLHQDLKTGKFLLPWPKCESRLAVIVELCTRLNLDDRPGASDAFDLPYSKISQHASNKKEPQALKMKIREDERCLIRPIGFDGTENEVEIQSETVKVSKIDKIKQIFNQSKKIVENTEKELEGENRFFSYLVAMFPKSRTIQKFREILKNDMLYYILMEKSNSFFNDYIFLIDEKPILKSYTEMNDEFFEMWENVEEKDIRMISLFLFRKEIKIQRLANYLHQKMSEFFDWDENLPFSDIKDTISGENEKNWKLLKSFGASFCRKFLNPCLDLPNPEEIHLKLGVYWKEFNSKESYILLSKNEKLCISIDLSQKRTLIGDFEQNFDEFKPKFAQNEVHYRKIGFGFNYYLFSNFDTEKLKENFGISLIKEIPRLFPAFNRYENYHLFISYIFQLNISPLNWPWIIYSEISHSQLREYCYFHENCSKRFLGGKDYQLLPSSELDFFHFMIKRGYSRPSRPRILEIPKNDGKSVKVLDRSRNRVVDEILPFHDVADYFVWWPLYRIEDFIRDGYYGRFYDEERRNEVFYPFGHRTFMSSSGGIQRVPINENKDIDDPSYIDSFEVNLFD